MEGIDLVCLWIAELVPLSATMFSFVYGLNKFFKKGKPLFLQSITMAMGCHALGSIYHLCQTLTTEEVLEGFTPAYLGRIGFFLFLITHTNLHLQNLIFCFFSSVCNNHNFILVFVFLYYHRTGLSKII